MPSVAKCKQTTDLSGENVSMIRYLYSIHQVFSSCIPTIFPRDMAADKFQVSPILPTTPFWPTRWHNFLNLFEHFTHISICSKFVLESGDAMHSMAYDYQMGVQTVYDHLRHHHCQKHMMHHFLPQPVKETWTKVAISQLNKGIWWEKSQS